MKPLIILLSAFLLLALPLEAKKKKNTETTSYSVSIDCQHCVDDITKELAFVKGVRDLKFDIEKKRVDVTYRTDKVTKEAIAEKMRGLGYEVKIKEKGTGSMGKGTGSKEKGTGSKE